MPRVCLWIDKSLLRVTLIDLSHHNRPTVSASGTIRAPEISCLRFSHCPSGDLNAALQCELSPYTLWYVRAAVMSHYCASSPTRNKTNGFEKKKWTFTWVKLKRIKTVYTIHRTGASRILLFRVGTCQAVLRVSTISDADRTSRVPRLIDF